MTSGDYDDDLDIDLAVANRDDNTATILTNEGAGIFSATTLVIGGEPRAVTFVDIDDMDRYVTCQQRSGAVLFDIG